MFGFEVKLVWGTRGRGFESRRSDHYFQGIRGCWGGCGMGRAPNMPPPRAI